MTLNDLELPKLGAPFNDVSDYMTTRTYAPTNDLWARPACLLVSSSKTKLRQFNSVEFN